MKDGARRKLGRRRERDGDLARTTDGSDADAHHAGAAEGVPGLGKPVRQSPFVKQNDDAEFVFFITHGRMSKDPANTTKLTPADRPGARVICPRCSSAQDVAENVEGAICKVCFAPLPVLANRAAALGGRPPARPASVRRGAVNASDAVHGSDLTHRAGGLLARSPLVESDEGMRELAQIDKRVATLLAFVPGIGALRVWKSPLHRPEERFRLAALSVLTTALLFALLWMVPWGTDGGFQEKEPGVRERIAVLRRLVEDQRRETGSYPGEATWKEALARADMRYFDPWGRLFTYQRTENGYSIGTLGRDGEPGGRGEDADVVEESIATE